MLDYTFWGNTLENWGISIFIFVSTIVLAKLLIHFIKKTLIPYSRKTKTGFDDVFVELIEQPIIFGVILLGMWIAIHRLVYPEKFVKAVDIAYKILIVLNITWLAARLINSLIDIYWTNHQRGVDTHKVSTKMIPVVKRTVLVLVWIIGIIMALSNVGVNITAVLGTLGIGGIAFALAAQDTIKNIFGAFTILTDKPFAIGDTIKVDGFEGTILDVGVRSTKMMTDDKRVVTFPNYKIADASIENVSTEPMRRVVTKLRLKFDNAPEKMKEALETLREIPNKVNNASPEGVVAFLSEFAEASMTITFIYFIEQDGWIPQVTSDVNMEILTTFNNIGLKFATTRPNVYIGVNDEPQEEEDEEGEDELNLPEEKDDEDTETQS